MNQIINQTNDSQTIEVRNDSNKDLIVRVVKVESTGNVFIYIENKPFGIKFKEQEKLSQEGWQPVIAGDCSTPLTVKESKW